MEYNKEKIDMVCVFKNVSIYAILIFEFNSVSSNDQSHNCFYPSLVPNNNQHLQEGASHFNRFVGNQPPEPMSIPPYPAQQYPVYDVNGQANFIESRYGGLNKSFYINDQNLKWKKLFNRIIFQRRPTSCNGNR